MSNAVIQSSEERKKRWLQLAIRCIARRRELLDEARVNMSSNLPYAALYDIKRAYGMSALEQLCYDMIREFHCGQW
jgi:hypothetical protein